MRAQRRAVLCPIAMPHHTEASVLWKVLETVRTICMKLETLQSLYHSDINYKLSTDVNITGTINCSSF